MRVAIGTPPLEGINQTLMQNRQYQEFSHKTTIYPVIPAYAATIINNMNHDVLWMDGPTEGYSWQEYKEELIDMNVDLVAWEVKTPTVKRVWELIKDLKSSMKREIKVCLFGDHVTALPEESLKNSEADYIVVGGHYDYGLVKLLINWSVLKGRTIIEAHKRIKTLPVINRELTNWRSYAYKNGNFKYTPGTYTQFARDCWHRKDGGCTFCSWTNLFKNYSVMSVDQAMEEIENCASLGVREIFDDSGTFPIGAWLHDFCKQLRKFNKGKRHGKARITMGCNMRAGALKKEEWNLMGRSGFRFILFGLESANQRTLERINKGQKDGDIQTSCRDATKAGLETHATCMVGFPWESKEDAEKTIGLTRNLFNKGMLETLQATICIPYPGTKLFKDCEEEGLLRTKDWPRYNMKEPIMKCPIHDEEIMRMTRDIYKSCITPGFIFKRVMGISSWDDFKYCMRAVSYMKGHLNDFR